MTDIQSYSPGDEKEEEEPDISSALAPPVIVQNILFWPLFVFVSLVMVFSAAIVTTGVRLFSSRSFTVRFIRRVVTLYGRIVMWCWWPFVWVRYRDRAPHDPDDSCIIVCNHRAATDAFLMACMPFDAVQLVNDWPLRLPVLGWVARLVEYIDITNVAVEKFYQKGQALLEKGVCVISFPEGTRSGSPQMGPFTSSVFRLALRAQVPIVPLAISGNEDIPPKGSFMLRPGHIKVHKLPAVRPREYEGMDAYHLKQHLRNVLQEHLNQTEERTG
ncbi:MAG: lysophospholipid acyltransferase family protein [Planctomycetota bacterium]